MAVWLDTWAMDKTETFLIARVHGGSFIEKWAWMELSVWSDTYDDGDTDFFWDATIQTVRTKSKDDDEIRIAGGEGYLSEETAKAAARAWLATRCGADVLSNEDKPRLP